MSDLVNKRNFKRFYLKVPVSVDFIDPNDGTVKILQGITNDINSEGLYIELESLLSLGDEAEVSFRLPGKEEIIKAKIRVVRVELIKEKAYGIGVVFTRIQPNEREIIRQMFERVDINKLLDFVIKKAASDLHLTVNSVPVLRVNGRLHRAEEFGVLSSEDIRRLVFSILSRQRIKRFEEDKELDFGLQYDVNNRFRINLYQQRGFLGATLRLINTNLSSFENLGIPEIVKDLAMLKDGLILITGPTGSGKTTTIAAMVECINQQRESVIITLERPIEYIHRSVKSVIEQREIGVDSQSFATALKSSLRQDPNVIVVGELEDVETIKTALTASEAGYLVIASFHAHNTVQCVDRLVNMFPVEARRFILAQLANCLRGVVCQLLIPNQSSNGRILAAEVAVVNEAIKNIIRNDELIQLPSVIQTHSSLKMQTMADSIKKLMQKELIDLQVADFYSSEFNKLGSNG